MIETALRADGVVTSKLNNARASLELLSSTQDELERSIPSSRADNTPVYRTDAMTAVKTMLDEYKAIRLDNDNLANELRDAAMRDDIVPRLLEIEASGKKIQDDLGAVFAAQQQIYEPYIKRINANIERQTTLLNDIKVRSTAIFFFFLTF